MSDIQATSMEDVARVAGVSHQTVSRVINNSAPVRQATREKVEAAIKATGYVPNNAARTLATKESMMIGIISVGSFLYGPTQSISAIEQAARAQQYTTLLATVPEDSHDLFFSAVNSFLQRSIDALIVIASRELTTKYASELSLSIPFVLVTGGTPEDFPKAGDLHIMGVDQAKGAQLAVRHLAQLGHRKIALLHGPGNWIDAQNRTISARKTCANLGITPQEYYGDWSADSGYALGANIASMAENERPTAIFSANDHMALGLLAAFHKCGISVPRDISVIGFDNVPESAFYSPALSTISQDFEQLGTRVLGATLELIAGNTPQLELVQPQLILRDSTCPPWDIDEPAR